MKFRVLSALALCVLSASVAGAQTFAEQLQRAIYTQSAVGDIDGAIKMYQQIIASAPANSEVKTQAERLMAAANAYRREGERPMPAVSTRPRLATIEGNFYTNLRTGTTFTLPKMSRSVQDSQTLRGAEVVTIDLFDAPGALGAAIDVSMFPEEISPNAVNTRLFAAPSLLRQQRAEQPWISNWQLREGSRERTSFGGRQAVVAQADYKHGNRAMVELMVWVYTTKNHVFFSARIAAENVARMKPHFDAMVASVTVP